MRPSHLAFLEQLVSDFGARTIKFRGRGKEGGGGGWGIGKFISQEVLLPPVSTTLVILFANSPAIAAPPPIKNELDFPSRLHAIH